MGAQPKKRHSTRRKGKRRAAISATLPNLTPCPNCKEMIFRHRVCPKCGFYKGKKVIDIKKLKKRKEQDAQ